VVQIWQAAVVLTGTGDGEPVEVIRQGAVAVGGDRIVAVGPSAQLVERFPDAETIDVPDGLIMPGFVDGHHHQGLTPICRGARAMSLEHVFTHRRSLPGPTLYDDTLFGALMLLRNGVTTVNHLHVGRRGPWSSWRDDADTVLAAYREAGIRVNFTFNFRDQNRLVYDGDDWFGEHLPGELGRQMTDFLDGQDIPLDAYLDELFVGLWKDHGRNTGSMARVALAPHNLHWCTDESIVAIGEVARRHGVHVNMHLLESPRQKTYAERRTGTTAIRHLADLGVLDGGTWSLLHAVWATGDDLDVLAQTGTRVCSSIGSNLLMGSGIAPLYQMRERGVPLSIGLDEGGMDGRYDVFSDLRLTQGVHQRADWDHATLGCEELLLMATAGAAASTEFADDIGTLQAGRLADFVVIDWAAVNDPGGEAGPSAVDDLVMKASSSQIQAVVVGGRTVIDHGVHPDVDETSLRQRIAHDMQSQRDHVSRDRILLERVRPHVAQYWANYCEPAELAHLRLDGDPVRETTA